MGMQRYQLMVNFVASDVVRWYDTAPDGETAVIARARSPAIWLFRLPHAHVYWWTEGEKGLAVSRNHARMPHCSRWGGRASLLGGLGDRFPQ
jgi:hypothetical protein